MATHAAGPDALTQQPRHPVVVSHAHTPDEHTVPAAQALPHRPQLPLSVCSSTQAPLHNACPMGQVHCGLVGSHVCPPAHAVICQEPFESHVSLPVLLAHWVTPGVQTPMHAPITHA
jgi:hypothetical protein